MKIALAKSVHHFNQWLGAHPEMLGDVKYVDNINQIRSIRLRESDAIFLDGWEQNPAYNSGFRAVFECASPQVMPQAMQQAMQRKSVAAFDTDTLSILARHKLRIECENRPDGLIGIRLVENPDSFNIVPIVPAGTKSVAQDAPGIAPTGRVDL